MSAYIAARWRSCWHGENIHEFTRL